MAVTRKGYVHALEGVVAALIVVVYLNSIVTVPDTTDWETVRISKQSEDLMSALDRSGFLDRTVMRDDRASFTAFTNTLSRELSYSIKVSGLPNAFIDVGVLVDDGDTSRASTTSSATAPAGVPSSEDGSGYREGTLTDQGFNDLGFVLSDTVDNGIRGYSAVNVDLNGDADFADADEGPYNFSDRFVCDAGFGACTSTETYEIGSFNTTLVVYNASTAAALAATKQQMDIGERTVRLSYETVNPADGSFDRFDVLWAEDWTAAELRGIAEDIEDFLREGRMLVVHAGIVKEDIDGNYLSDLGFDYINEYRLSGSGAKRNTFYSMHGPRNGSYRSAQYYLEAGIVLDGFEGAGDFSQADIEINSSSITVKRWTDDAVASFGSEGYAVNYSVGDPVVLKGNQYVLDSISPFVLEPSGQQRFASFDTVRINADYHATRMEGRSHNITDDDTFATFDTAYGERDDIPGDYDQGLVKSGCSPAIDPYKNGSITIRGTEYAFMLVNFEPETGPGESCDPYSEFVYFDIGGNEDGSPDGDYDDDDLDGSSIEGPHQDGGVINVSGTAFTVHPHLDGEGVDLKAIGPRLIGELPVSTNVQGERGSAMIVRRQSLGHDDMHLLASVMVQETQHEQAFTTQRSLGDTSLGYTYSSSAGDKNTFGYTLQTVWWFQ